MVDSPYHLVQDFFHQQYDIKIKSLNAESPSGNTQAWWLGVGWRESPKSRNWQFLGDTGWEKPWAFQVTTSINKFKVKKNV